MVIETKTDLIMQTLTDYYNKHQDYIKIIQDMYNQNSFKKPDNISLRLLDWFVTNYSKKYIVILPSKNGGGFNVYQQYRLSLKSYGKGWFDSCKRKERIEFYYNDTDFIETTCGQLGFFKWCFENGIFEYIKQNMNVINNDMKISLSKTTDSTTENSDTLDSAGNSIKRRPLSDNALRGIVKNYSSYSVSLG